jgi:hypothetical protein
MAAIKGASFEIRRRSSEYSSVPTQNTLILRHRRHIDPPLTHLNLYLLTYEIPALPTRSTAVPVPFPVPSGVAKGRKFRTTWISYEALAALHFYLELDRAATVDETAWRPPRRWGEPLVVTEPDERGVRRRWDALTPGERRRLVAPGGGSCLLAVRNGGGPFTAWSSVFERTADRIRIYRVLAAQAGGSK